MAHEPLVYIIVLNWNCAADTMSCVDSCLKLEYRNRRILIVDNNSSDNSVAEILSKYPDIEIIQNSENLGYAGGNNVGICCAIDNLADYLWVLNPDIMASKKSLSLLIDFMEKDQSVGLCGSRVMQGTGAGAYFFDGVKVIENEGYEARLHSVDPQLRGSNSTYIEVDCVSGSSMLIRSTTIQKIGLLREDFFMYYEDTEFSFRARREGWKTVVYPKAVVTHGWSKSKKSSQISFFIQRNRILFARTQKKYVYVTLFKVLAEAFKGKLAPSLRMKLLLTLLKAATSGLCKPLKAIPYYQPLRKN